MYTDEELARRAVLGDHYATAPGKVINDRVHLHKTQVELSLTIKQEAFMSGATNGYAGSIFTAVNDKITLGCISPEASDLLDRIMDEWEKHLEDLKKTNGEDYEPSYYGFAYWLVRWSGLIQPA